MFTTVEPMLLANRVIILSGILAELLSIMVLVFTGVRVGQRASVYSSGFPSMCPNSCAASHVDILFITWSARILSLPRSFMN